MSNTPSITPREAMHFLPGRGWTLPADVVTTALTTRFSRENPGANEPLDETHDFAFVEDLEPGDSITVTGFDEVTRTGGSPSLFRRPARDVTFPVATVSEELPGEYRLTLKDPRDGSIVSLSSLVSGFSGVYVAERAPSRMQRA